MNELKVLPKLGNVNIKFNHNNSIMALDQLEYMDISFENETNINIEKIYYINSQPAMFGYECNSFDSLEAHDSIKVISKLFAIKKI